MHRCLSAANLNLYIEEFLLHCLTGDLSRRRAISHHYSRNAKARGTTYLKLQWLYSHKTCHWSYTKPSRNCKPCSHSWTNHHLQCLVVHMDRAKRAYVELPRKACLQRLLIYQKRLCMVAFHPAPSSSCKKDRRRFD